MKPLTIFTMLIAVFAMMGTSWGEEGQVVYKASVELVNRDGLVHEPGSETPLTGKAVNHWPNGQKKAEIDYLDGKRQGKELSWTEKGQKQYEGENLSGKSYGKFTTWHENGQKAAEIEMRDGKPHGKLITWHQNGQKESEGEWRDGTEISRKCWDEKGNPIDCEELSKQPSDDLALIKSATHLTLGPGTEFERIYTGQELRNFLEDFELYRSESLTLVSNTQNGTIIINGKQYKVHYSEEKNASRLVALTVELDGRKINVIDKHQ